MQVFTLFILVSKPQGCITSAVTICGEVGRHKIDRTGQEMEIMSVNTPNINE